MTTRVVNRTISAYEVYVGRPTEWGNPYSARLVGSTSQVLTMYRHHLRSSPELVEKARRELKGKVIACWCTTDLTGKEPIVCHAQILARVADGEEP